MLVLHQKPNPEEGEAKEEHQREHHPPATANLRHGVWRMVSAAVRASISGDILAHKTAQFIRVLVARQRREARNEVWPWKFIFDSRSEVTGARTTFSRAIFLQIDSMPWRR